MGWFLMGSKVILVGFVLRTLECGLCSVLIACRLELGKCGGLAKLSKKPAQTQLILLPLSPQEDWWMFLASLSPGSEIKAL